MKYKYKADKNGVELYDKWITSMFCDDCDKDVDATVKLCDCDDCKSNGREEVAECNVCNKWLGEI